MISKTFVKDFWKIKLLAVRLLLLFEQLDAVGKRFGY